MGLPVGQTYRIKKDVFSLKKGEIWTLKDQGYQAYYGEHNFRFINSDKDIRFMVLRDAADTDMEIYRNLELYFEEIK
jgi:hypothetical protein